MNALFNKRILLGVTGSIAAYKACDLARQLTDAGCDVRVVMTRSAMEFVSPLTFQALSRNLVHRDLLDENAEAAMGHIELARWADAIVVAPASANFLARLAAGRADDLLTAICLATSAPLAVAPAMNQQMWQDQATQENLAMLKQRKIHIFGPATGDQACGETGPGRMLEAIEIRDLTMGLFESNILSGVTVLLTAGPTREPIDPVRFISNRSSGRMGYAIAKAIIEAGGRCIMVSGPTALTTPDRVDVINIETSQQMYEAVKDNLENANIFISAAAVSDYRPIETANQKMKKKPDEMSLPLTPTIDILKQVSELKNNLFTVGFAAETQNLEQNAKTKLQAKSLNMIIANDVSDSGIGFDVEDNEVTVYWQDQHSKLSKASKAQIARQLVEMIAKQYSINSL